MLPTREIFWNIKDLIKYGHYIGFFLVVLVILFGIYRRSKMWRMGKEENRFDNIGRRFKDLILYGFIQKRIFRDRYAGIMHFFIFFGFLVLLLGTAIVTIEYDTPLHFFFGNFYILYSFVMDFHGVIFIVGISMAFYRRYVTRPEKLDNKFEDFLILFIFLLIALTGFFLEALRIQVTKPSFEVWSFVGWNLAKVLKGISVEQSKLIHTSLWVLHSALTFLFLLLLINTKFLHMFTSPLNIFFQSYKPKGALPEIPNIEEVESLGASKIEDFTWKQLLDLDACTRCGRCQEECPAYNSKKPLSPKKIIQDLKTNMIERYRGRENSIYDSVSFDEIWSCTTCRACMEECPVFIEHVPAIVDMRRFLVFDGKLHGTAAKTLQYIMNRGNPWGFAEDERGNWCKDLNVKLAKDGDFDILFWVGCAGSYDPQNQKVAKAIVKILNKAHVNFAILGNEEKCTGDSARRLGEEFLFYMIAQENIEILKKYKVKKILTMCPHCYNTLKNEYPQFGGEFEVLHHTEFICDLIEEKKIKVTKEIEGILTYHDSCYLGRYNNIYEKPRKILKSLGKTVEMKKNRDKSFCCGAGGGHMWMETLGERINHIRLSQAMEVNPDTIATACPFCLLMFDDAVKAKDLEEKVKIRDLAQLVEEVIE